VATYTRTFTASLGSRITTATQNRSDISAATHGYYSSNGTWVGIVHFSELNLSGYNIDAVKLTLTANSAGGTGSKTIYLNRAVYQALNPTSISGSNLVGSSIGTISGKYRSATVTNALSGSTLANMASYLASGGNTIILYHSESAVSGQSYSANYSRFTSISMEVTYSDPASLTWSNRSVSASQSGKNVVVSWNAATGTGGSGDVTYTVYAGSSSYYAGTAKTLTITPPLYDTTLTYYVVASYSGITAQSNTASLYAYSVRVTEPVIQSLEFSNGVFTLSWSASSGSYGDSGASVSYVVYYGDTNSGYTVYSKSAGNGTSVQIAQWIEGVECRFFVRASYSGVTADSGYISYTIPAHRTVMFSVDGQTYTECIVYYCADGQTYTECIPYYCADGQTYTECSH